MVLGAVGLLVPADQRLVSRTAYLEIHADNHSHSRGASWRCGGMRHLYSVYVDEQLCDANVSSTFFNLYHKQSK